MGLMHKIIWAFSVFVVLQGSADDANSPSPAIFDAISPAREETKNVSSPSQSNVVSPPLKSPPAPETTKYLAPFLSPSTRTILPPNNWSAPPTPYQGIVPSLPPSASQGQPPPMEDPIMVPEAPVAVLSPLLSPSTPTLLPPNNLSSPPTTFQNIVPSLPPSASQGQPPPMEDPILVPEAPVPLLSPFLSPSTPTLLPRNNLSAPPTSQGIVPSLPPRASQGQPPHMEDPILVPEAPVPVVSPTIKSPENSPSIHPVMPGSSSPSPQHSKAPDTRDPLSAPIAPVESAPPPREKLQTPPTSHPIVPEVPYNKAPLSAPIAPGPDISPISITPPRFNWKRHGIPVAAPSYVTPKQFSPLRYSPAATPKHSSPRDFDNPPPPLVAIKSPPHVHSPTPVPTSSYRHYHARENITTPAPSSYLVPPPASDDKGLVIAQTPSYPPKLDPKRRPLLPASPPRASSSRQTRMPVLSPEISPSGSSPKIPKMPHLQPNRTLPPPPPNAECTPLSCDEPLTNTLPGSPCDCIMPMQVGLRLGVALYTFFPLVSEFAAEIAAGVFLKQSQVRIMGANAASEDPGKTIVLMDLVPLEEKFDNTTAYMTYQRFWHKQVLISPSSFGDYEVLYVRYTGLPDSPPSAPSSIGEPHDNKGSTIKPVGVDITKRRHKEGLKGVVVAVIVLSASVAVILFCAIAWILSFRHRDRDFQVQQNPPTKLPSLGKSSGIVASMTGSGPSSISPSYNSTIAPYTGTAKTFTLSDMETATDNFAASRIIGEGGFGLVYSGVLEDGTKVAVKVLKRDDQQGEREFLAEVEMLTRLHHRNLVKLIGICSEEHARCLIYELIPNGSVDSHIHGVDKEVAPLDWGARLKIALGAARGLAYLHEDSNPRVIHRDFKSSNILLEHDFTPKVSDFGLARSGLDEENRHILTRVMGTFGYVAPEYAMTGHLLVKSDVYSYGVVLLELLTGRKPVDMSQPLGQENLVTWSRPLLTSEKGLELIVDKSLGPNFPFDSISKVAAIASMCVQAEVSHRPFMGEVVQALKLVCNECNAAKDLGSRSCSQEDLSVDFDARSSTHSGHLPDPLQMQTPLSDYECAITVERGLPLSEMFSASARIGKTDSGSFRRHSSSGPLRSESVLPLWQRMRRLSGGSVSEHGAMFKLWHRHH